MMYATVSEEASLGKKQGRRGNVCRRKSDLWGREASVTPLRAGHVGNVFDVRRVQFEKNTNVSSSNRITLRSRIPLFGAYARALPLLRFISV